jgi:hypothetical protein
MDEECSLIYKVTQNNENNKSYFKNEKPWHVANVLVVFESMIVS